MINVCNYNLYFKLNSLVIYLLLYSGKKNGLYLKILNSLIQGKT